MHVNNLPIRWMGQRQGGGNFADALPGEHVEPYLSIEHAKEVLREEPMRLPGDSMALWSVSPDMSYGECVAATRTDLAEADRLLTLGPRDGVKVERL